MMSEPNSKIPHEIGIYLNSIFNNVGDPIFVKDDECRLLLVNDAFCTMFGLPRIEIIGKTLAEKVPLNEKEHFLSIDKQVLLDGKEILCEETLTIEGSITRTILTKKNRFIDSKGHYFLVGVIHDITQRKENEEKLKLAASVFSHSLEEVTITDSNAIIVEVNTAFTHITGYSRNEAIGKNPSFLHSGRQSNDFYTEMWKSLNESGYWTGEIWNRRKNGEVYAVLKTITAVYDEQNNVSHYIGLGSDITMMKKHQHQLEHMANFDILTDLPNRSLFLDRLSQAMSQCTRHKKILAVVFIDIDGFKAVNDTYGHDAGDDVLIKLSQRMKEALREGDTLARFGGDEFVALLVDLTKAEDYKPVLERLLLASNKALTYRDITFNLSTSIGVSLYPQNNVGVDQLLHQADQAMYLVKGMGKNSYHLYDPYIDNKND